MGNTKNSYCCQQIHAWENILRHTYLLIDKLTLLLNTRPNPFHGSRCRYIQAKNTLHTQKFQNVIYFAFI